MADRPPMQIYPDPDVAARSIPTADGAPEISGSGDSETPMESDADANELSLEGR